MSERSVILIGGPDSGKTNYIGRLWPALDAQQGSLVAAVQPPDIGFVIDTAEHLFEGRFAPRSHHNEDRRDFEIVVGPAGGGWNTKIIIPDISGELWRDAVKNFEISEEWMEELRGAHGALLFVRVNSDQNIQPLDWVTSRHLLQKIGHDDDREKIPTQVMLCELIRYLELTLSVRPDGTLPRLSVIVSAWDLVDDETRKAGPNAYLEKEFPLVAGRVHDTERLDVKTFGLSVVGGDLKYDEEFRDAFLDTAFDEHGWVAARDQGTGKWKREPDLALPVLWVIGD